MADHFHSPPIINPPRHGSDLLFPRYAALLSMPSRFRISISARRARHVADNHAPGEERHGMCQVSRLNANVKQVLIMF